LSNPSTIPRRGFLKAASAGAISLASLPTGILMAMPKRKLTDIHVKELRISYESFPYRRPYEFGRRSGTVCNLINVHSTVETVDGHVAEGFGSMTMGVLWSFPSKTLSFDTRFTAMKRLAERIGKITTDHTEAGHPIQINFLLQPEYLKAAVEITEEMHLDEPIPKLFTLVTASAFDAAVHDAFGKARHLNSYLTYGPEFMSYDLGHYLAPQFKGEYPSRYLLRAPQPWLWCNNSVGESDPIDASEVKTWLHDGLPNTLPQWIDADGLSHFKVKLGITLEDDIGRMLHIDRVVTETETRRGVHEWHYSLDFNEQCPNADYMIEFLRRIKEASPTGYNRITYIEQPESRNLEYTPAQLLFKVSKLKPVTMDEALTGFDELLRGRKVGYTGVALKACKGQSECMLLNAAAQRFGMLMTAQDLTCPGASLIQSAGIAAHVPQIRELESNAREYVPAANQSWVRKFPGLFEIRDGKLHTGQLTGPGLSAV
jgi:L-alanine-DL-glutamate epimerase-like enolase superfamily enzyme